MAVQAFFRCGTDALLTVSTGKSEEHEYEDDCRVEWSH